MPGSAKSTVISSLIEQLKPSCIASTGRKTNAVAFVYLEKDLKAYTSTDLMGSILRQIIETQPGLSTSIMNAFRRREPSSQNELRSSDYQALLQNETANFDNVYILIDALDRGDRVMVSELLDSLKILQRTANFVKILVSSLDIAEFKYIELLKEAEEVEVLTDDAEIKAYVQERIRRSATSSVAKLCNRKKSLRKDIEDTICAKARGLFLIAKLLMDILTAPQRYPEGEFRKLLANLPDTMGPIYQQLWDRVLQQSDDTVALAKSVFAWVTYCEEPLTIEALQYALHTDTCPDSLPFDESDLILQDDIGSVCLGIIVLKSKTVEFVHHTAQEYFKAFLPTGEAGCENDPHYARATTCMRYLELTTRIRGVDTTPVGQVDHLGYYAMTYWGVHASRAEPERVSEEVFRFLSSPTCVQRAAPALIRSVGSKQEALMALRPTQNDISGIHVAAFFGLNETLAIFLKISSVDEAGEGSWTPLRWAIFNQQIDTVQLLIKNGANLDLLDERGETSLVWAVDRRRGAMKVENMAIWDCTVPIGQTYVSDFDSWFKGGRSESTIVRRTSSDILRLLARETPQVDKENSDGRSALSFAAETHDIELVRELLGRKANSLLRDKDGMNPLLRVLQPHNLRVYENISIWSNARVDFGLHVLIVTKREGTANRRPQVGDTSPDAQAIAEDVAIAMIESLDQLDPAELDLEASDLFGRTALALAARKGYHTLVKRLLKLGADPDRTDLRGQTPLLSALLSRAWYCSLSIRNVSVWGNARVHIGDSVFMDCDQETFEQLTGSYPETNSRQDIIRDLIGHTTNIGQLVLGLTLGHGDDYTSAFDIAVDQGLEDVARALQQRAEHIGAPLRREDSKVKNTTISTATENCKWHIGDHYYEYSNAASIPSSMPQCEWVGSDNIGYGNSKIHWGTIVRFNTNVDAYLKPGPPLSNPWWMMFRDPQYYMDVDPASGRTALWGQTHSESETREEIAPG